MAPMIIVQYADISAAGFSRQEDRDHPAPRAFWQAAEDLLFSDVVQPPESIRSTAGEPVWSLRRVTVEGRSYWCFAVQGRGGPFGVAGTCRFGFIEADGTHPADAWARGRSELTAGDPPVRAPDAKAVEGAYRAVIAAVLLGRPVVEIPLGPAGAAALIPRVLAALPASRTRRWSWSTCLLQRPELGGKRVAAGQLPETMAANATNLVRNLEQMFSTSTRDAADALRLDTAQQFGFDWLVKCAINGRRLDAELQTTELSVPRLLERIAELHKELQLVDVPRLLADATRRSRLLAALDLLRRWTKSNLPEALRHVRETRDSEVRQHLFGFLVELQEESPGENLLGLPTASQPQAGWCADLADLLDRHFQADDRRIADFALGLTVAGGIYADPADRRVARSLWLDLGVHHDLDGVAVLFEASADILIEALRAEPHRLSDAALDEIGRMRHPVADVVAALDKPEYAGLCLAPDAAAELVEAVLSARDQQDRGDDPDPHVGTRLRRLAWLLTSAGGSPEWAYDFLHALLSAWSLDRADLVPLASGTLSGYGHLPGVRKPVPRGPLRNLFLKAGLREGPEDPLPLLAEPPAPRPVRADQPAEPVIAVSSHHDDETVTYQPDQYARSEATVYRSGSDLRYDHQSPTPYPEGPVSAHANRAPRRLGPKPLPRPGGKQPAGRNFFADIRRPKAIIVSVAMISVMGLVFVVSIFRGPGDDQAGPPAKSPVNEASRTEKPATKGPSSPAAEPTPDPADTGRFSIEYLPGEDNVIRLFNLLNALTNGRRILTLTLSGTSAQSAEAGSDDAKRFRDEIRLSGLLPGTRILIGRSLPGRNLRSVIVEYRLAPLQPSGARPGRGAD